MKTLLGWLLVLGLGYFAWTEGWPWLRAELDRFGAGPAAAAPARDDEATRCVALAAEASRSLAGVRELVAPPVDTAAWMRFAGRVQARRQRADSACGCFAEACDRAREAMSELERLLQDLDGIARGSSEAFFNPATRQQRIDELLDEARSAL